MRFNLTNRMVLYCGLFLLAACSEKGSSLPTSRLLIETAGNAKIEMTAEIADNDAEREKGLMFRQTLDEGRGMLFVFEVDQVLAFWMKNTTLPLSIAYIAYDGRILEIHDMRPLSLSPISSERSARYALEVPQGWFNRQGIVPGDRVIIPR